MNIKNVFKRKTKYEYIVEYCTDIPVCGMALFKNNGKRDHRGKFYYALDYVCSRGSVLTIDSEKELFVSDAPRPYTFKAESDDKARKKFLKYMKRIDNAYSYLKNFGCGL